MATNELDRLIELIEKLSSADREKLASHLAEQTGRKQDAGRASRLLEAAQKMKFASGQTDVSERSRDILDSEFGTYLDNHMS